MLSDAYLGLGSNLGDRRSNIERGLRGLREGSTRMTVSGIYETTPVGFCSQPPFLNAVCRIWTPLDPFQLMAKCAETEAAIGTPRAFVNGPRPLDVDILIYGRTRLECPGLSIPHPRMVERAFVLRPLAEIAPELRHPVTKETIKSLLARVSAHGVARRTGRPAS